MKAELELVAESTREATAREVMGSMVEQSMKRRVGSVVEDGGGKGESRMESKTARTCWGSGREVMIVSFEWGC